MSELNPYQPAPEIKDSESPTHGEWIYRRIAAVSSAIGSLLVGLPAIGLFIHAINPNTTLQDSVLGYGLCILIGAGLIIAGYHWHGRDVNKGIGWWIFSFTVAAVSMALFV